jgi:hypothetical protein
LNPTEINYFYCGVYGWCNSVNIEVHGVPIHLGKKMKYLGVNSSVVFVKN